MKKLLFITTELPYPAQSGGKVKSLKLLQALAQSYQVTLACPLKRLRCQRSAPVYVLLYYYSLPCAVRR